MKNKKSLSMDTILYRADAENIIEALKSGDIKKLASLKTFAGHSPEQTAEFIEKAIDSNLALMKKKAQSIKGGRADKKRKATTEVARWLLQNKPGYSAERRWLYLKNKHSSHDGVGGDRALITGNYKIFYRLTDNKLVAEGIRDEKKTIIAFKTLENYLSNPKKKHV